MKGELTAIIEKAPEGGYWAICPEVAGATQPGLQLLLCNEIIPLL